DADPAQPAPRPRARSSRRGAARSRLRSLAQLRPRAARVARAEDPLQLVGGGHLELVVAAVARPLVRAPAHELRGVPEAGALHVVVRDLADTLGPERLPAQVLAPIPAAARPRHALARRRRLGLRVGPVAPGMTLERVRAQGRQLGDELLADGVVERGGDADVVQGAVV